MKHTTLYTLISTSLLLTACGGGGSTGTTTALSTYQMTGTVPGTLIEAYCDDGSIHKVNSTKNSTNKHPFALKLPKNQACRVVMITNEKDQAKKVVTPIKFIDQQGKSSIIISSKGGDIDVGHVSLSLTRAGMTADTNSDGVEDIPMEVILNDADAKIVQRATDPMDRDKDGILNVYEDDDGDGVSNHDDNDDDGDGILDINDNDHDNDGVADNDLDGDGIKNKQDSDIDNDGIDNAKDTDDDNDGIKDSVDKDDDNDGVDDSKEHLDTDSVGRDDNNNGSGNDRDHQDNNNESGNERNDDSNQQNDNDRNHN